MRGGEPPLVRHTRSQQLSASLALTYGQRQVRLALGTV
jgi:hypothetical protein